MKMIVTDLDRTLLRDDKGISPYTMYAPAMKQTASQGGWQNGTYRPLF